MYKNTMVSLHRIAERNPELLKYYKAPAVVWIARNAKFGSVISSNLHLILSHVSVTSWSKQKAREMIIILECKVSYRLK